MKLEELGGISLRLVLCRFSSHCKGHKNLTILRWRNEISWVIKQKVLYNQFTKHLEGFTEARITTKREQVPPHQILYAKVLRRRLFQMDAVASATEEYSIVAARNFDMPLLRYQGPRFHCEPPECGLQSKEFYITKAFRRRIFNQSDLHIIR